MNILDMADRAGIRPKWVASTAGGEYHSECPNCGGRDRFYIQPYKPMLNCVGSYSCRKCGLHGDAIQFARQFLNYSFQEAKELFIDTFHIKNHHYDPRDENSFSVLKRPNDSWIFYANILLEETYKILVSNTPIMSYLEKRGINKEAVEQYKLGWNPENEFFSRDQWGLECTDQNKPYIWFPEGLIIPTRENNGDVVRLKVRRFNMRENDTLPKYIAISGSMNGLNIIGSVSLNKVIIVESELDAFAIDAVAHDLICAIAVGSNIKNPDNVTDRVARNAQQLLICHDNDQAGKKMLIKWQKMYPHAISCSPPEGKDVGESIQKGLNIREWILKKIK